VPSPYHITNREDDIPDHTAKGVEQHIIHIKTPHSCYQLKALHKEAHSKTVEKGKKKATIPACHRHKKSKWYENQDISEQICIRYPSQNISIQPKSFYFTEKNQVIMIFPGSFPSIPVRKNQKVK